MLPRHLHRLIARLALAWFALALGVAAASPLVQPRAMQLVCSAGGVKLLVDSGDGLVESGSHPLDCALCLLASAPPPAAPLDALPTAPAAVSPQVPPRAAPRAVRALAPLPARGPPLFS